MAFLETGPIDSNEYVRTAPQGQPVPPGVYHGLVVRTQQKRTNDGTGVYVEVEIDITHPQEFANRKFWDRFNVLNKSTDAARIGKEGLADLAKAANIPVINDDEELLGCEVMMELQVEEAKPYVDKNGVQKSGTAQNKCRKYWPMGTDVESARKASKGQAPAAAPAQARPAQAAPQGAVAGTPASRWPKVAAPAPQPTHAAPVQQQAPAQAPVQQAAPAAAPAAGVAPWKRNKQ